MCFPFPSRFREVRALLALRASEISMAPLIDILFPIKKKNRNNKEFDSEISVVSIPPRSRVRSFVLSLMEKLIDEQESKLMEHSKLKIIIIIKA